MISIVKIISSTTDSMNRRIAKFLRLGNSDVQERPIASPFGFDFVPPKNTVAVYAKTMDEGKPVIIGFIHKNAFPSLKSGESRIFSIDSNDNIAAYINALNTGILELNGNSDFLVRYNELKAGFDELRSDVNSLIADYNGHIHPGVQPGGGVSGSIPVTLGPSSASIVTSKINSIKCP